MNKTFTKLYKLYLFIKYLLINYKLYNNKIIYINTIFTELLLIYIKKYYNCMLNYIKSNF